MIYFDNAATGGFKPDTVYEKTMTTVKYLSANAGRSGHKLSIAAAKEIFDTRKLLGKFIGNSSFERIIFTSNCTDALNKGIFGTVKKGWKVLATVTEHNSVLRPLYHLQREGVIDLQIISPKTSSVTCDDVKNSFDENVKLVIVNAVSNVTGSENDIDGIGEFLKNTNALFMVDGAQIAGHKKIDMFRQHIDVLCLAGHKGLLSIQGVGVLAFSEKVNISPVIFGGTGTETFNEDMPDSYPERLEAGTSSLPAICSLKAGVEYLVSSMPYISSKLSALSELLISKLSQRPFVKVYSIPNPYGIVAFEHIDIPSQELSQILSDKYDIAVRGGFHCAPLMHKFLKTEKFGLVRISLSPQNTRREISMLLNALDEISFG